VRALFGWRFAVRGWRPSGGELKRLVVAEPPRNAWVRLARGRAALAGV